MIKAVANGYPMGEHRRSAMRENIDMITEHINGLQLSDLGFLRVA